MKSCEESDCEKDGRLSVTPNPQLVHVNVRGLARGGQSMQYAQVEDSVASEPVGTYEGQVGWMNVQWMDGWEGGRRQAGSD